MVYVYICSFIWGFRFCNKNHKILLPQKVCTIVIEKKIEKYVTNFSWKVKTFFWSKILRFLLQIRNLHIKIHIYSYMICQYYISFRYVSGTLTNVRDIPPPPCPGQMSGTKNFFLIFRRRV